MSTDEHGTDIPSQLPPIGVFSLHEREMLYHLFQEAGEVVQAVSKLLLFGRTATNPYTGKVYDNCYDLGIEVGNLHHMIEICHSLDLIPSQSVQDGINMKEERLALYRRT